MSEQGKMSNWDDLHRKYCHMQNSFLEGMAEIVCKHGGLKAAAMFELEHEIGFTGCLSKVVAERETRDRPSTGRPRHHFPETFKMVEGEPQYDPDLWSAAKRREAWRRTGIQSDGTRA